MPEQILFVCTGNFYRSRFSEIYFNHLAMQRGLAVHAFSRGLQVYKGRNKGPIAKETINFLGHLGIPYQTSNMPVQCMEEDLLLANSIILMDREEHYPMMVKYFPHWKERVKYWSFQDVQHIAPDQMLPELEERVRNLVEKYKS